MFHVALPIALGCDLTKATPVIFNACGNLTQFLEDHS